MSLMKIPDIIIAIDGYSATGKSSFAKLLANEFGMTYLDSGALYRAVALFAQEKGFISSDNVVSPDLEAALSGLELSFNAEGKICIGDCCVEKEIRSMEVSSRVSPISAEAYVREFVDEKLHRLDAGAGIVMDGRDIGTAVFPEAQLKLFMTASVEVRARRRFDELEAKGEKPVLEEVIKNLQERDYIDSHRETHPLCKADDAFVLDNSNMTLSEELAWVKGVIQGKFGILE